MNNKNLNSKKKNSKNKLAKKIAKSPKNSNVVKLNTYFNTQNLIHFNSCITYKNWYTSVC